MAKMTKDVSLVLAALKDRLYVMLDGVDHLEKRVGFDIDDVDRMSKSFDILSLASYRLEQAMHKELDKKKEA